MPRQPAEEEEDEKRRQLDEEVEETIQTKRASNKTQFVIPKIASNIRALRGFGQPLPRSVKSFFGPRFGHDFSQVRVPSDTRAAQTAAAVNAKAFTAGRDIVFGRGQYSPETAEGKRLLGHELTHALQQVNRSHKNERIQRQAQPNRRGCRPRFRIIRRAGALDMIKSLVWHVASARA